MRITGVYAAPPQVGGRLIDLGGRRRGIPFTLRVEVRAPTLPPPVTIACFPAPMTNSLASRRTALAAAALAVLLLGIWATPKVLRRLDMQGMKPVTVAKGLVFPGRWPSCPMACMLVTERPGRLRVVQADGTLGPPIAGLPRVGEGGEGGLLDVTLDPRFGVQPAHLLVVRRTRTRCPERRSTAVARGRLVDDRLEEVRVIFRQPVKSGNDVHFGSRLLFDAGLPARRPQTIEANATTRRSSTPRTARSCASAPTARQRWKPFLATPGGTRRDLVPGVAQRGGLRSSRVRNRSSGRPTMAPRAATRSTSSSPGATTAGRWSRTARSTAPGPRSARARASPACRTPSPGGAESVAPSGMTFLTSERYPGWKGTVVHRHAQWSRAGALAHRGHERRRAAAPGDRVAGAHPRCPAGPRWMALHPHRRP